MNLYRIEEKEKKIDNLLELTEKIIYVILFGFSLLIISNFSSGFFLADAVFSLSLFLVVIGLIFYFLVNEKVKVKSRLICAELEKNFHLIAILYPNHKKTIELERKLHKFRYLSNS